jgi:S1-C subfamily serine protease
MRTLCAYLAIILATTATTASSQERDLSIKPNDRMNAHGATSTNGSEAAVTGYDLDEASNDLPTEKLAIIAGRPSNDVGGMTRSAKDAQIYRAASPSVVLIATKDGLGSGSLLDIAGNILTNFHVVRGYETVGIVFKPSVEGKQPGTDEIKRGQVVKYDEIADLAIVRASEVPTGRAPIRLAEPSEIAVGMDVHAIGHPTGEAWTYTTGVISQYRLGYEWKVEGDTFKHKADIIQTQTPINPGNSGGPLLGDSGNLIGVNSFKSGGEGLNFAVSVDEVRKFIARNGSRIAQAPPSKKNDRECVAKKLSEFRSEDNDATIVSFDLFCTGKDTGEIVTPDDRSLPIMFRIDRNGDGAADVKVFDLKRRGRWDISFWDEKYDGHWTLVGYHEDGGLKPTRFESYAEFQRRTASR